MALGELSESALDLLLTDIIVWPVRVVYRALGGSSSAGAPPLQVASAWPSWNGTAAAGTGR